MLLLVAFAMVSGACGGGGSVNVVVTSTEAAVTSSTLPTVTTSAVDLLAISEGRRLFEGTCAACHGFDAMGIEGLGRTIVDSVFIGERTDAEMIAFLVEGRKADHPDNITGVDMPPRGGNDAFTDQDLGDIVAYVRSLRGES